MDIVLDFDGTIIDASDRMYMLFKDIAPEFNFSKEEYWKLKRDKISHKKMFEAVGKSNEFNHFNAIWMDRIEAQKYLEYDKLYPDMDINIKILAENNRLILLTARQCEDKLKQELGRFDLEKYFSEILVTGGRNSKKELLKKFVLGHEIENNIVYISDMGQDVFIGNKMGIKTIAVTYGFMSEERLIEYNPDFIVRNIKSAVDIIMRRGLNGGGLF